MNEEIPKTIEIPASFMEYEVVEILGVGSSSTVAKVINSKTNEIYAGKFIERLILTEQSLMVRIESELRVMERIKHPSLIELKKIVYLDDFIVILMEYLPGGSMSDKVSMFGGLNEIEMLSYLKTILEGLNFLHSRGISHRDLKLENIVFDKAGQPILIDFGMSCLKDSNIDDNLRGTFCGTLEYLAPEMFGDKPYDATACDIWSLGVCVYVMATNKFPWEGSNTEIRDKIKNCEYTIPKCVTSKIHDLINIMLQKDPRKRPSAAALLKIIGEPIARRRKSTINGRIFKPVPKFASLGSALVFRKNTMEKQRNSQSYKL